MAFNHIFILIFALLSVSHDINASSCTLDFSKFPYEAHSECFNAPSDSCCRSALQSVYQAMTIRANNSRSIFLELDEAEDCSNTFQNLHQRTNLSKCQLQKFISSQRPNICSKDVDSVINALGTERYYDIRSTCKELSTSNYSDDTCFSCAIAYRQSLQTLKESDTSSSGKGCAEALLVSLASSDIQPSNWVHGTFSCLWDEIESPWPELHSDKGSLLGSKKLLAAMILAGVLVIIAPILYKITKMQLQYSSKMDFENLSVLKKTLDKDEASQPFNCSDLYIFSQDEMEKATNTFNSSNLIWEGTLGKTYVGVMPSGMRVAITRFNKGVRLQDFINLIREKAKIRHTNLVSMLGYCNDRGDQCLVYEYCVNGNLSSWLSDDRKTSILTWGHRKQIIVGIARGLWFLHNNHLQKMGHGDIKLTNILLNEKLAPKITDSILSERMLNGNGAKMMETFADDVFNFGVVLLQVLTGRKQKHLILEERERILKGGNVNAMADNSLKGVYVPTEFQSVFSVALLCTTPNELERPSMEEILRKLEETRIHL